VVVVGATTRTRVSAQRVQLCHVGECESLDPVGAAPVDALAMTAGSVND